MPRLTRWFVKTSFLYLALALMAGLLIEIQSILKFSALGGLFPVYIHLFVLGWITQLIFGVVFWMFPRYSADSPRRSETLGWWTYALLNIGLILRVVVEPIHAAQPNAFSGWSLVISAIMQFLAGLGFVVNSWGRVKVK